MDRLSELEFTDVQICVTLRRQNIVLWSLLKEITLFFVSTSVMNRNAEKPITPFPLMKMKGLPTSRNLT
jgi:hypothetical protein